METSLCPLYDLRFYSSSVTNVMHSDYEEDLFHLHSIRENENIENVFYFPADIKYATFSNTVQDGDVLDSRLMEDMDPVIDLQLVDEDRLLGDEESRENLVNVGEVSERSGVEEEMVKELSVADLLLMGADAVQTEKWQLASTVISRLTHLLCDQENEKNPFNRLAFFFTEALRFKSFGGYPTHWPIPGTAAPTTRMSTFQMLQELTSYVKFAHFTANQAILESAEGATHLHLSISKLWKAVSGRH
ncbi:protein NODULATION SIGNALING PATHWAY 2-like [Aristolochia californica]|uniref:protein NODULATION SIGNALING PATHWAY 2-like n=1 Tax=Aristolochia californica TaxID=171875 RepID=UPI0035E3180B